MATFGVTLIANSGGTVESYSVEHKNTFKQLINSTGTAGGTHIYDEEYDISASGKGANPYPVGAATAPSGVSGKFIVTSSTKNSKNDDYQGWSMSGTAYKFAT
jgi:hypothetical protein